MPADPQPASIGDELVRAADRDLALTEQLLRTTEIAANLAHDVAELRTELADERRARERLELRLYAHELRDADLPLISAAGSELDAHGLPAPSSRNVVPLIREYAPDTEELPTIDEPELAGDDDEAGPDA